MALYTDGLVECPSSVDGHPFYGTGRVGWVKPISNRTQVGQSRRRYSHRRPASSPQAFAGAWLPGAKASIWASSREKSIGLGW